jgi:hypothetical protein
MSVVTPKNLYVGALTASNTILMAAVGVSKKVIVREIILCNNDTTNRSVTINFVPNAGSADNTNRVISSLQGGNLASGETKIFTLNTTLEAGETIQGLASVAGQVSCRITGGEIV